MTAVGAQWDRAKMLSPAGQYTSEEWRNHWAEHPDTLLRLIGDIYRVYKGEEKKKAGLGNPRGGRRKSRIDGDIEELWSILEPRISLLPFAEAFAELKGERSLRAMALKTGMPLTQLQGKVAGTRPIFREDLEQIARAMDVHPAYFLEWRIFVVQELIGHILTTSPNLSISLLKGLSL